MAEQAGGVQVHVKEAQRLPVSRQQGYEQHGAEGEQQAAEGGAIPAPTGVRAAQGRAHSQGDPVEQDGSRQQIAEGGNINQHVGQHALHGQRGDHTERLRSVRQTHHSGIDVTGARQHRDKMHHGREDQRHDADGERQMRNRQRRTPAHDCQQGAGDER